MISEDWAQLRDGSAVVAGVAGAEVDARVVIHDRLTEAEVRGTTGLDVQLMPHRGELVARSFGDALFDRDLTARKVLLAEAPGLQR